MRGACNWKGRRAGAPHESFRPFRESVMRMHHAPFRGLLDGPTARVLWPDRIYHQTTLVETYPRPFHSAS
jgi:hypothetical protein